MSVATNQGQVTRRRKQKVLHIFALWFTLLLPLLGLTYWYIGSPALFSLCMIAGCMGMGLIFLGKMTKNVSVTGNIALLVFWATLAAIKWQSGLLSAGDLILLAWVWNAVVILLAIYLTGYFWGTMWAGFVFVESGLAVYFYRIGHSFTSDVPPEYATIYSLGAYLLGLLTLFLIAFLFEKEKEEAFCREQEKADALAYSVKYVEEIIEQSPIPTFVLDRKHRVVHWNRACQELTGIASQQIIGKGTWEGFHMDQEGALADKLLNHCDNPVVLNSDPMFSVTKDGNCELQTTIPSSKKQRNVKIRAGPILAPDGSTVGAIQTILEIADAQEASRPRANGVEATPGAWFQPSFEIDLKGKIASWNHGCEKLTGFTQVQMIGRNPLFFVHEEDRSRFRGTILGALRGEPFAGQRWRYRPPQGKAVHVLARGGPLFSENQETRGCMVINEDITDLESRLSVLQAAALEDRKRLKKTQEEYALLRRNVAALMKKRVGSGNDKEGGH
jgi:PAS domain S-box-containing protein